jgi:hypothetical protein
LEEVFQLWKEASDNLEGVFQLWKEVLEISEVGFPLYLFLSDG